jgi:hypothetical protein
MIVAGAPRMPREGTRVGCLALLLGLGCCSARSAPLSSLEACYPSRQT